MSDETKQDDGGPAFPLASGTGDPRDGVYCQNGMSLRDWFAGKALQGLMANPNVVGFSHNNGWGLVNCTTAQIADYAKHVGNQMIHATGDGQV